jgi:hypothetical protein
MKNLEKDKKIIAELKPLVSQVVEKVNSVLSSLKREDLPRISELLPEHVSSVYFVDYLSAQTDNGGYSQFIYNSKGLYNDVVSLALERIGANYHLDVHKNVLEYLAAHKTEVEEFVYKTKYSGDGVPARDEIDLVAHTDFVKGDMAYYEVEPSILELLQTYVNSHKETIEKELSQM